MLILTLLVQEMFCVITYGWKDRLDIRAAVTHQHYDQEYYFPELDPLFVPRGQLNLSQRLLQDAAGGEEVFGIHF